MNSKKVVLKLDLHDDRDKQKAMKAVSKIPCIDSIAVDMKTMKLTVVGDIDPVYVVSKLRKHWSTEISSVGPAKEPEKKKEDPSKKEGGGGGGGGGGKKKEPTEQIPAYIWPYYQYPHHIVNYPQQAATHHPQMASPYYVLHEENPNGCVIC